jgi:shikimate dehydrogenase
VEAVRVGAKAINGEEMLLHQGIAAFRLWTGREAPEKVMREAMAGSPEQAVKKTRRRKAIR